MLKKVIGKAKDALYESVVEKDAEELVKHLGNKEAILAHVEKNKIPERKSSYEMLYEALLEKLDDEHAEVLYAKKFHFVERKKLSVLWEEFADINEETRLRTQVEKIENRLAKIHRLQGVLATKETALHEAHAEMMAKLGEPVAPLAKEPVAQPTQQEVAEALLQETQLFGQTPIDPTIRETPPREKEEDEIMKNF